MDTIEEIVAGFIAYLKSINQLSNLPKIIDCLNKQVTNQQNTALITSSTALNSSEIEKIHQFLKKKLGKDFVIDLEVDKTLMGGIKIEVGDQIIDLSLNNRLNQIIDNLTL